MRETTFQSIYVRLGDTRESVREKANIALCKLMDATVTPQQLFEKLIPHFSHKNGKVHCWMMFIVLFFNLNHMDG